MKLSRKSSHEVGEAEFGVPENLAVEASLGKRHEVRRILRNALAIGVVSAGAAFPLMRAWPARSECGPHDCTVIPTLDGHLTVTPALDQEGRLPSGGTIGANIELGDISLQNEDSGTFSLLDASGSFDETQLRQLSQLYTGAADETSINNIKNDVFEQYLKLSAYAAAGLAAGYHVLGKRRRIELANGFKRKEVWAAVTALTLLTSVSPLISAPRQSPRQWESTGELFKDTPLEGLEVRGSYLKASLDGVKQVIDYIDELEDYYNQAAENAVEAIRADEQLSSIRERFPDATVVIRTSDIHCNTLINKVLVVGSDELRADIWVDTGDTVVGGSSIENICVTQEAKDMPKNRVGVGGNHGSSATIRQQEDEGFIMLDGTPQTVGGLTFLGAPDPNSSPFGRTTLYNSELSRNVGQSLIAAACNQDTPPIMLGHSSGLVLDAIVAGCADYGFTGHTHKSAVRSVARQGILAQPGLIITSGTTGGVKEGAPSFGKLRAPAFINFDVFTTDKKTGATLQETWELIVHPDQSAEVRRVYSNEN